MAETNGARQGSGRRRSVVVPDLVGGLLIIGVGAVFAINALQFEVVGEGGRLAPGAMPFFSGILLALTGVGVIVKGVFPTAEEAAKDEIRSGEEPRDPSTAATDGPVSDGTDDADADDEGIDPAELASSVDPELKTGRSLLVLAAAAVATWLAPRIGFLLAFAVMIVGLLVLLEREKLWKAVLVAAGAYLFAWLLFVNFLNIPIPEMPFF
jgi:hypothetical protein